MSVLVLGIDAALLNTGVAAIEDGKATWRATVEVEGDPEDTGPRFAGLRKAFETLVRRQLTRTVGEIPGAIGYRLQQPAVVGVEQPEHGLRKRRWKGRRYETDPAAIMKLYGAFAVVYAECVRLFPAARVVGVMPEVWKGRLGKRETASLMGYKYHVRRFANDHESDALGIADWAWDLAVAGEKKHLQ